MKLEVRNRKLRGDLKPILSGWVRWVREFTRRMPYDAVYWYNERATVSSLAVAIGRLNHLVLEEWRTDKHSHRENKIRKGRSDLWFCCGDIDYLIEAKQMWITLPKQLESFEENLAEHLRAARNDVARIRTLPKGTRKLGLVFIVPRIRSKDYETRADSIRRLLERISKMDIDAYAFAFPFDSRQVKSSGFAYPGVACCVRMTRKT